MYLTYNPCQPSFPQSLTLGQCQWPSLVLCISRRTSRLGCRRVSCTVTCRSSRVNGFPFSRIRLTVHNRLSARPSSVRAACPLESPLAPKGSPAAYDPARPPSRGPSPAAGRRGVSERSTGALCAAADLKTGHLRPMRACARVGVLERPSIIQGELQKRNQREGAGMFSNHAVRCSHP